MVPESPYGCQGSGPAGPPAGVGGPAGQGGAGREGRAGRGGQGNGAGQLTGRSRSTVISLNGWLGSPGAYSLDGVGHPVNFDVLYSSQATP
jgi:hypothetical protein